VQVGAQLACSALDCSLGAGDCLRLAEQPKHKQKQKPNPKNCQATWQLFGLFLVLKLIAEIFSPSARVIFCPPVCKPTA